MISVTNLNDVFDEHLIGADASALERRDVSAAPDDERELAALAQFVAGQHAHEAEDTLVARVCPINGHQTLTSYTGVVIARRDNAGVQTC